MDVDEPTARLLWDFLEESQWYPGDDEYRQVGDLKISPETAFKALQRYRMQQDADDLGLYGGPEAFPAESRVTALQALACDRLLAAWLKNQRWVHVYESRKAGASWADVGAALGVTRQSAHEMYAQDLQERAEWWKGRIGAEDFARRRPEYESVLAEQ
ncbi:hypothetical protein ACFW2V_41725 [Streptomyces sp. NPDC058947]|uniref:hypothetical protein n=1 Tax=Streptomyces TaxID=1883 RepID=UPI00367909F3